MNNIQKFLEDDALSDWVKRDSLQPRKEGEVTAREYATLTGMTADTARRILFKRVEDGVWESRKTVVSGKEASVFWPKK